MGQPASYRKVIKQILSRHAELMRRRPQSNVDVEVAFDDEHDNYMLLKRGWTAQGRLLTPVLYVRVHDGKIWIEVDWTEYGIADELLENGVPESDIVLAFHTPELRRFSEPALKAA